jgi:hypothetical protein
MVSDLCGETYLKVLYGGVFFFFLHPVLCPLSLYGGLA